MDTNERTAEEGEEGEAREGASSSSSTHPKRILALWSIAVVLFIVSSVYTLDESQRALLVYRLGPSRAALQAALQLMLAADQDGIDSAKDSAKESAKDSAKD